jgi:glycosyltransferase involved in cell wall biosynthesis
MHRIEIHEGERQRLLRVLQIGKFYAPKRGGMETHLKTICDRLSPYVKLETLVANTARRTAVDTVDGIRVVRAGSWLTCAGASLCPSMIGQIRRSNADLIHIHLPNPPAVLAYLLSGHQGRLVMTYHSDIVRQKFLAKVVEPMMDAALARADALIVTSAIYLRTSPVLSRFVDSCRIIPFGISLDEYNECSADAIADVRARFGSPLLLTVGRLVYYKGMEHLVRAMAGIPATLLVIGEGPLKPELERLAREVGAAERVHFLDRVEDLMPYYRAAEVFVFPSVARSESFGLVQLEAMACGLPIVNTCLPSAVPFVSVDGISGFTVAPGDPQALAAAVNRLLENPGLRSRYARAARRRVEQQFSMDGMIRRILEVYREAAGAIAEEATSVPVLERFRQVMHAMETEREARHSELW